MEEQHEGVDKLLTEVRGMLPEWRAVADPAHGAQLAEITARLQARLVEHLQTEEVRALPLVEKHVTAAEWLAMVAEGAASIQPELGPLIFGLMAYEGDPATVQNVIATMPPELGPTVANDAAQAFAEHALRVHGTATPEHIGTRSAKETL
jgi:hypothetical protein